MKKNKVFLVFLILIIIIELCITVILLNFKEKNDSKIISPASREHINNEGILTISNPSEFLKMDVGSISRAEIVNVLKEYVTGVLPVAYSSMTLSEDGLKQVYIKNMDMFEKCGIDNYKELSKLIEVIKTKNIEFDKYESIQFNTCKMNDGNLTVSTSIMYKSGKFITVDLNYDGIYVEGLEIK